MSFRGFGKDIALFDFESTGFRKNAQEMIIDPGEPTQLGVLVLDRQSLEEKTSYMSDIQANPAKLEPWVLENTDITAERLKQAPTPKAVAEKLLDIVQPEKVFLASWNVYYDRIWLDQLLKASDHTESVYDYHHLDVWTLAYQYLCAHGYTQVIRSEATFQLFGQASRQAHNALDDCRRTAEVLRAVVFDQGIPS